MTITAAAYAGIPGAISTTGWVTLGAPATLYPSQYNVQNYGPANGYYIDHVRLYVLAQILELQSELMIDLMEARNAVKDRCPGPLYESCCRWHEVEGR